jgi:hypothetical protein
MTYSDIGAVSAVSGRIQRGSQVFAEIATKPPAVGMVYRMKDTTTGVESIIWIRIFDPLGSVSYDEICVSTPWLRRGLRGVSLSAFFEHYFDHHVFEIGVRSRESWERFAPILAAVIDSKATFAEAVRILCTLRSFGFMEERGDNDVFVHGEVPMSDRPVTFSGGAVRAKIPLTLETLARVP